MTRSTPELGMSEIKAGEKKVEGASMSEGRAPGTTAFVTPSPELAEIVGAKDLLRCDVDRRGKRTPVAG